MSERSVVYLKDRQAGKLVEAALIDGVSRDEVERAEAVWNASQSSGCTCSRSSISSSTA